MDAIRGRLRNGLGIALMTAALAACTSAERTAFPEPPEFHATATQVTARLALALPGSDGAFGDSERARAAAFLDAYRDGGRGPLAVAIVGPNAKSIDTAERAIRLLARRRGVPGDAVLVTRGPVTATPEGRPGLTLRYTDFVATAPKCNPEIVLSRNPTAEVSPNLGCAIEQGLAAMVAHPVDLATPAAAAPADGARMARVIDLYHQGKATQSEANRNDDTKASASTISLGK